VYGESATSVPADSAPSPATTVADTSCPRILGKVTSGFRPRNEFKSLPQNPTILTFSKSSPCATTGSGTVTTDASPGPLSTSAFTVLVTSGRIRENTDWRSVSVATPNVYYRLPKLNFEQNYS